MHLIFLFQLTPGYIQLCQLCVVWARKHKHSSNIRQLFRVVKMVICELNIGYMSFGVILLVAYSLATPRKYIVCDATRRNKQVSTVMFSRNIYSRVRSRPIYQD
jgi:hypothetical protein